MFNIIFPIIIFVSLAVIVFIVGKHLPEFVDIKKNKNENNSTKNEYFKKIFFKILETIKDVSIWLVENIIKQAKNLLTLVQNWLLEIKKKKKEDKFSNTSNGEIKEIEKEQNNFLDEIKKEKTSAEQEEFFEKGNVKKEQESQSKENFFSKFKNDLKERLLEKRRKKINQVFQEDDFNQDQFSDGVVSVHEKKQEELSDDKKLINEVVEIKKDRNIERNFDEEIGVDRHILEKKLINKITENPKDKEIYRQLGELYLKMENYSDAENCYKYILKIAVRDVDAIRKIERIKLLKRSKNK
jgi:tetratricopeptide (TPR) repeat protein